VFVALMALGLLLYLLLFRFIARMGDEQRIRSSLLVGFGLTLILHTAAVQLFSADERSLTTAYAALSLQVGALRLPVVRVAGLAVAVAATLLLERFLARTRWGVALRATSENWQMAALSGVDVGRAYLGAFALSAGLAGLTGALVAVGFSVNPSLGLQWTLKALIVVVLAGLGSMRGTLLAGLLLGVAEALAAYALGGEVRELVGLLLFLGVITVRPQGLFGDSGGD
ncbi:MAG: branched-chain amino acid ABC transporter permease, partial [Candidatus Promineifilaceae bacterium]|nr:branched-chain amino acid ABC transporter permease [Candidatus Promineifilaceae bacterium]